MLNSRQTMGSLNQATGHFEDALAFCRKAGYRAELAWTCCDYTDMLLERNGEVDRAKVITLLDESLAISSELGMRPLMELCCPSGRYRRRNNNRCSPKNITPGEYYGGRWTTACVRLSPH